MYGKIFTSMYDGTLHGNWEALVTFQQMIVIADDAGTVDITPSSLSARTGIPLDILEKGILILESDDPYSRTPTQNGKRIERLDDHRPWGWRIINYMKYRQLASYEEKKKSDRERIAKKRNKNKGCRNVSQDVANVAEVAYTDTDTDKENILSVFEYLWKDYPNKDGKKQALKSFQSSVKTKADFDDIKKALANYKAHLKTETWKRPKNGSTWFNNWRDWVNWQENGSGPKEGDTRWHQREWEIFKAGNWVRDTERVVV